MKNRTNKLEISRLARDVGWVTMFMDKIYNVQAHHIKIVQKLEVALARIVSGNAVAYRYEMFKGDEGNITSLNTRIIQYFKIFQDIKSVARESLEKFLPTGMCDMYIDARYIIPEYLYDNFYKEKLVRRDKLD